MRKSTAYTIVFLGILTTATIQLFLIFLSSEGTGGSLEDNSDQVAIQTPWNLFRIEAKPTVRAVSLGNEAEKQSGRLIPTSKAEVWNIARRKSSSFLHTIKDAELVNDGVVRPLQNATEPSVLLRERWRVDLGDDSYVQEVLVILHQSAANVHHNVTIAILDSDSKELRRSDFVTVVGVVFWRELDLDSARYLEISSQNGKSQPLPLEEVEVYGAQQGGHPGRSEPLTIIITGYHTSNVTRGHELLQTLMRNLQNPYISRIHILQESCSVNVTLPTHPKITRECKEKQPTYGELFQFANDNLARQLVVITNGDIIFTDSLRHLGLELLPGKKRVGFIISRWALNCPSLDVPEFEHRCWSNFRSYDAFIYRPKVPKAVIQNMTHVMNRMFSEHMTARVLKKYLALGNPCLDIVSLHNHCSAIREWKRGTRENDYIGTFSGRTHRFRTRTLENVTVKALQAV